MIKLSDLAPDLARRIAEDEAHRRECNAEECNLCGRRPARRLGDDERSRRYAEVMLKSAIDRVLSWIPPEYAEAELDAPWLADLVGRENIAQARTALSSRRVVFLGEAGSGKTSLAAAMYRAAARAERLTERVSRFRWVSSHQLAKARSGHALGAGEAPLVEACMTSPLLVLDELGGEDPRMASAVAEVLYERHAEQRATWVTTGVGSKEIAARYGGGIARRVFEGATVFKLARKK